MARVAYGLDRRADEGAGVDLPRSHACLRHRNDEFRYGRATQDEVLPPAGNLGRAYLQKANRFWVRLFPSGDFHSISPSAHRSMKKLILKYAPVRVQDFAIGIFHSRQYRTRHGERYSFWRQYFASWEGASREALEAEQARRLREFLDHVTTRSDWYRPFHARKLAEFPLLEKRDILSSL